MTSLRHPSDDPPNHLTDLLKSTRSSRLPPTAAGIFVVVFAVLTVRSSLSIPSTASILPGRCGSVEALVPFVTSMLPLFVLQPNVQQRSLKMVIFSNQNTTACNVNTGCKMQLASDDPREMLGEMIRAERHRGVEEAYRRVGKAAGLAARQVIAIVRGEKTRLWHDEWLAIRDSYAAHLERRQTLLDAELETIKTRLAALDKE